MHPGRAFREKRLDPPQCACGLAGADFDLTI
jgi:hypothetical protein